MGDVLEGDEGQEPSDRQARRLALPGARANIDFQLTIEETNMIKLSSLIEAHRQALIAMRAASDDDLPVAVLVEHNAGLALLAHPPASRAEAVAKANYLRETPIFAERADADTFDALLRSTVAPRREPPLWRDYAASGLLWLANRIDGAVAPEAGIGGGNGDR